MSTNTNFDVTPVTSNCSNTPSNVVIKPAEGSATSDTLGSVDHQNSQLTANSQYDTINEETVTAQTGGKKNKKYNISFINKNYVVYEKDELNAIKNMDMLSSVIVSYIKLYKVSLYSDIESELSTSWDSIWISIKRLNPNVRRFHDIGTNLNTI